MISPEAKDAAYDALDRAHKEGYGAGIKQGRESAAALVQHRAGALRAAGKHAIADELQQVSVEILTSQQS